ncbi:MAG: MOSC domain-containing protein [Roseobacter sp.]|jgi:uncharacterized protein YcbX|nr:MOSC domain-containing protein [Roseobacter sp.]
MTGTVQGLFHYPVKGLSAQPLKRVNLQAGQGFPMDRVYGFARPGSGFDPDNPRPLPKTKFVVLARDAGLATLKTHFDLDTSFLTICPHDKEYRFDLRREDGRAAAARVLSSHLGLAEEMTPTLFSARPHRFTDVSVVSPEMMNAVSLINLDSVAAFSEQIGSDVSAARFRGNIHVSGIPAFSELDWVGRALTIGEVELQVVQRTKRCPATEVDPETGLRDLDPPGLLRKHYGHSDMGVYAEIRRGGFICHGDRLRLS